jgi:hypothetical protein
MTPPSLPLSGFHSAVLDYRSHRTSLDSFLAVLRDCEGVILVSGNSPLAAMPLVHRRTGTAPCLVVFSTFAFARRHAARHAAYRPWLTGLWWLVSGMPSDWGILINPGGPSVRLEAPDLAHARNRQTDS